MHINYPCISVYRIAGFFRGENFSRIDLIQIFEGKIFTNHSTGASVIIITREITRVKFSQAGMVELYEVEPIVRGYYIYKEIWSAAVGSTLPCLQERFNTHDIYTTWLHCIINNVNS